LPKITQNKIKQMNNNKKKLWTPQTIEIKFREIHSWSSSYWIINCSEASKTKHHE
jgi:hypothetical protein